MKHCWSKNRSIYRLSERFVHGWHRVLFWFKDAAFRRLFLNAGRLLTATGISVIIGFATTVMTARALGPEQYGILALVLVYQLTIGKLVTFNAWQAIIKYGSEALGAKDDVGLRQLFKLGFCLDIGSAIVGTVLALALTGPTIGLLGWDQDVRPLMKLYSILILFSLNGTPIGILRLFDRFDLLSYSSIVSAVAKLLGVILCLATGQSLFGFVVVYLVTGILGQSYQVLAALWVISRRQLGSVVGQSLIGLRPRFPRIWDYVWTTNVNSTIRIFSHEADELIIAWIAGPPALGLFKVAKQFSRMLPMLIDPLYQSIYPELSRAWASGNARLTSSLVKRSTLIVSIVATSGWAVFVIFGQLFITLSFGGAYSAAYFPSVIYMLALVIALITFSLQPLMLSVGKPKSSLCANAIATTAYLLALIPMINIFGITGCSATYVLYYCAWSGIMIWMLKPLILLSDTRKVITNAK